VRGVIVEDQLDCRMGRIGGVEKLEEFDEFAAAVGRPPAGPSRDRGGPGPPGANRYSQNEASRAIDPPPAPADGSLRLNC
jgi:hypothetical protein